MSQHAKPLLLQVLRKAVALQAEEVRFVTGQQPALKLHSEVRPAYDAPTRGELVQALHEVCLREAGREDLQHSSAAKYTIAIPELGVFHCEFQLTEHARTLRVFPAPEAGLQSLALPRPQPSTGRSSVEPGESS